jgi:EmrB/QacA subfamily drug resistance transporter
MPATLSIITVVFPRHERAKAIAIWAGFAGAGGAIGVLAGGLLLEIFWWGSVFFINVPIGVIALAATVALVPTSRERVRRPLDPVGSLLSIAGLGALVLAIIEGPERGWTGSLVVSLFVVSAVLLVAFVRWELRSPAPMLDPHYFRNRHFSLGSFTISLSFMGMFGMFFLITQYFQFAQGHSPIAAAVRTLPFALTMVVVAPRSATAVSRWGVRYTVTGGLVLSALGLLGLGLVTAHTYYGYVMISIVLMAAGLALLMPPSTEAIVSSLPQDKAGVGSAVNDTTREVGGAIGIALLGSLASVGYRSGLGSATDGLPQAAAAAAEDSIGAAIQVAQGLGPAGQALIDAAATAFTDGMQVAMWVAAGIALVAAIAVAVFHPDREDQTPEPDARTELRPPK